MRALRRAVHYSGRTSNAKSSPNREHVKCPDAVQCFAHGCPQKIDPPRALGGHSGYSVSMSRQTSLTLTEELEKLEQSITLTLQEIDHNFSRAHRIVTSSILPIVEQYAEHSRDVWDGSKFWKQFFESSANVSLSGYEEQPSTHGTLDDTVTEESLATTHTTLEGSESYTTPSSTHYSEQDNGEDIDLSSSTISPSHSTPRPHSKRKKPGAQAHQPATFADYPSPYEALRREVNQVPNSNQASAAPLPSTPGTSSAIANQSRDIATTPDSPGSSPFIARPTPTSIPRPSTARKKTDPLLHRILDRNYRVQATPISNARYGGFQNSRIAAAAAGASATPATAARNRNRLFESTLSSSPNMPEAPQLHAEIFSSPVRKPRTPGVSVLTPAKPSATRSGTASRATVPGAATAGIWDSDDDDFDEDDDEGLPFGQSPPKTMQFHIPQSRLLKTPGM
jgi:DASH complex subunit ASK1